MRKEAVKTLSACSRAVRECSRYYANVEAKYAHSKRSQKQTRSRVAADVVAMK